MHGEAVSSAEPRTLAASGRKCSEKECQTILSVHNDSDTCSIHDPIRMPLWRKKKL